MSLQLRGSTQLKSALFDPPEETLDTPERLQLKRDLGALSYAEQVEAVKPEVPAMTVQTLQEDPVQTKGGGDADQVKVAAQSGLRDTPGSLPYLGQIQQAFGPQHNVSSIRAHTGPAARQANQAMGSVAYATGNAVAFKSAPDLHTVAHEAAHVVQQRAGVDLPGGVGRVGDGYEQHADAVADRVVAGKSAADLLTPAGYSSDPVQHLSALQMRASEELRQGTEINQDFFAEACRREGIPPAAVEEWKNTLLAGKPPEQQFVSVEDAVAFLFKLSTRDAYFNNALKVQFENQLGEALMADNAAAMPVLDKVLKWCLKYLETKIQKDGGDLKDEWKKMEAMHGGNPSKHKDLFYGRIRDSIDEVVNGQTYYESMRQLFAGGGSFTVPQKCLGIQAFHNNIYEQDWKGKDNPTSQFHAIMADLHTRAMDPSKVRFGLDSEMGDTKAENIFGTNAQGQKVKGEGKEQSHWAKGKDIDASRRGRMQTEATHGSERTTGRGLTASETGTEPEGQIHGRGIEVWTMDERQAFVQQARMLDMPLAGSVSGTTSDLITIAILAGVNSPQDKFLFICGALEHFIGAGAHTFHEVCTAASATEFGISYTPGDYYSFFEKYINSTPLPTVRALFEEARGGNGPYQTVKGIGKPL